MSNFTRCGSALESSDIWEAADTFWRSPWADVPGMSSWGNPEVCTLWNNVEGLRALAFQGHLLEEQDDIGGKRKDRAYLLQLVPPPPGQQWAEEEKRWKGGQRIHIPALFLCFWVVFGLFLEGAKLGHSCGMCFEELGMDVMEFRNKYSAVSVKNSIWKRVHLSQFPGLGVAMLWPSLKMSLRPRRRLLEGPAGWREPGRKTDSDLGAALSQTAWPWTQEALAYWTWASRWKGLASVYRQRTAAS